MRLLQLLNKNTKKSVPHPFVPHLVTFAGNPKNRRKVLHRAASILTINVGMSRNDLHKYAGSFNHSLNGARLFAGVDGRRARIFSKLPTVATYRYQAMHAIWWKSQVWRKGLYSAIPRPESQAKAATYALMSRVPSVSRNNRYSLNNKNRARYTRDDSQIGIVTGKDVLAQREVMSIFIKPYSYRVHYEVARMRFKAQQKATYAPTMTPTVRRYLERMWRVRFRLRFEKFFFKRTGCRTYVWLQSTFRGLRMSHRNRFRTNVVIAASKENRRLAAHWRWSTYQMALFHNSLLMMMTLPGNLELPFMTLRRLMKKHRSHFSVIRFFVGYIHKAMSTRRLDGLYNFRLRIAGKFVGELKRRVCLIGHGEMRLARYQIPADFYTTQMHTKYGVFGLKYWVQIFPDHRWFDNLMTPTQVVEYDDRVMEEDAAYPGWLVFEQDQLVAQWFFREAIEEYRRLPEDTVLPVVTTKTLVELGTDNRSADYKVLSDPIRDTLLDKEIHKYVKDTRYFLTPPGVPLPDRIVTTPRHKSKKNKSASKVGKGRNPNRSKN